ncbi:carbohydrate ABC transporter permease [Actinophytocola algeriensis]|uniref:Multiple sugar transport system permease protein n=1 Tax=Actinophytocola algeriensis TaxID=1768010 RepID=A0A7W7QBB3_9PSEU|nr:sugar ABC transporter permease [Actinophytocola algeriensis]MBB4910432.1 multiple sugar transport system permease protein [Actinophytocola algeriensis]MBE1480579.1 multiple sugar transport system permease protein [Actinophytocola algeriensis]
MQALPWLLPALVLIVGVVIFPAGYMVYTSFRDLSRFGKDRGWAGFENYVRVFGLDPLPTVLTNTVVWTVGTVVVTVLLSLVLAQFLNKKFPGRKVLRMVIIVPWAASVVMTSTVFVYGLDPFYGIINKFLVDVGIIDEPYGFLKNATSGFLSAMAVAVFVSVPFTTFVVLAGLQTIPHDVLEAASIDGAGKVQTYWSVVFPMLRPALAVAAIINIINVFNSLPILKTMTGAIPGNDADTTTTFMFKLIQNDRQIDTASALSVVNFVVIIVVIGVYLKVVKPMREVNA